MESAGGITEIVCMFAVLLLLLALFAFWQLVIAIIVLVVMALFSGGAALKYLRVCNSCQELGPYWTFRRWL